MRVCKQTTSQSSLVQIMSETAATIKDHLDVSLEARKEPEKPDKGSDPGASRHGNFMNYYQFHSAEERVRQLPKAIYSRRRASTGRFASTSSSSRGRKYVALDVGCNAGDLTLELYKFFSEKLPGREILILGIDLDPILIERAREKNNQPDSVTFECLDFFSSDRENVISSYLKKHEVPDFDVSFCFSITMWIHLNQGDVGLEKFLLDVCACSDSVVIEPQPWRCYRNAARRLRRAELGDFPLLDGIKYRGDVQKHIERILEVQCGFRRLAISEENEWQRRLLFYEKRREQT